MMLNAFTDASNVERVAHERAMAQSRIMDSFHDQGLFCTEGAQCA